ncbi:hypothetical protein RJ45_17575 [Photobacterium gaetbulicola]|uniref:Uncharacterized protein n=1 Tax=Photobacterium gaetbulicola TaxID=1295392 RepID=A0A0B9G113_9GAMM|nr:hypothetical protein RJ45_17575 [Photobacterium gaetbulicola]
MTGESAQYKIDPSSQLGVMFVLPHGRWLDGLLVWCSLLTSGAIAIDSHPSKAAPGSVMRL